MRSASSPTYLDPLYGDVTLPDVIWKLAHTPMVQRLRDVRMSNIDSLSMPGIANISRYEHSLGTTLLGCRVGLMRNLNEREQLILLASALLHDTAIQPFGHLIEEANQYIGESTVHEVRWRLLAGRQDRSQVGGVECQVYLGRQSGMVSWAEDQFGVPPDGAIDEILKTISGNSRLGPVVCGDIDIDNLDNVSRAAYHMGLAFDKRLPITIADLMVDIGPDGVVFADEAVPQLKEWLSLRSRVYDRFMLAREDFSGKVMLIYATLCALRKRILRAEDWVLTDRVFLERLLQSKDRQITDTVKRWLSHEPWALSDLTWFSGKPPTYKQVHEFSLSLSTILDRECLAYRIKDKTTRALRVQLSSGEVTNIGRPSDRWLLGVASPRKAFTAMDNKRILEGAARAFRAHVAENTRREPIDVEGRQPSLF